MWVNIERSDLKKAIRALQGHGDGETADRLAEKVHRYSVYENSTDKPFASTARAKYHAEGQIEIDSNAVVSEGDDGAYVMGWLWVGREELPQVANRRSRKAVTEESP